MENGVEALKIAASMLIFVLAITITISSFTTATQALNKIFNMQNEDEYVTATDENGNEYFLNFVRFNGGTREVGVETIIPSIYRAYKENYAIYFFESSGAPLILYTYEEEKYNEITNTTLKQEKKVNYIDFEKEKHASTEDAINLINELLSKGNDLHPDGLYKTLQEGTFIEKLGEYYMDDVLGETETADVNKTKKRVIVYTKQ